MPSCQRLNTQTWSEKASQCELWKMCRLGVTIAVINTMAMSRLERKGFVLLRHLHHSPSLKQIREGTQIGQGSGSKDWCGDHRSAAYWLALHDFLILLSYVIHDNQPEGVHIHSGLGLPPSTSTEKIHPGLPTGQFGEGIFLVEVPSS